MNLLLVGQSFRVTGTRTRRQGKFELLVNVRLFAECRACPNVGISNRFINVLHQNWGKKLGRSMKTFARRRSAPGLWSGMFVRFKPPNTVRKF